MKVGIVEKKAEAIKRMKLIKLLPNVIEKFDKENIIYCSEMVGIVYSVHNFEWMQYIKRFEQKFKALVYHAEFSRFNFGDCLSLFYVSDQKDEWELDIKGLEVGFAVCFVWNTTIPEYSDCSGIAFKSMNGGIQRTW